MNRIWGFIGLICITVGYCLISAGIISTKPTFTYGEGLLISLGLFALCVYAGWSLSRRLRKSAYWKNFAAGVLILSLAVNLYQALLP